MQWITKEIDLGEIIEGKLVDFEFLSVTGSKGSVRSAIPSCGCTNVMVTNSGHIKGTFKAGTIPHHLNKQGFYFTSKHIDISLVDGTVQRLTIKAKIIKK